MQQQLLIQGRLPSRNEAEDSARTHWSKGAYLKKQATELVMWEAVRQHIKPYKNAVEILIRYYEVNRRRDVDNVISASKYILDGLVKAKVLVNDTQKYVKKISSEVYVSRFNPRVEVIIYDVQ